jgi:hypothetical protein
MKLKLYEIESEYISLAQAIIEADGVATPEQEEMLKINQTDLETKARGYGFICKDLDNDIALIDAEISRLQVFKTARNKTITQLKDRLLDAMILFGVDKIESPTLNISLRNSESVEIEDEQYILDEFCTIKTTKTPNKTKIKEAIKQGEVVFGAVLKQNKNIQIK